MQKYNKISASQKEQMLDKLEENYSKTVVDHCLHPRNLRRIDHPDGYAQSTAEDGDIIEMFVLLENKTVMECTYQTNGCAATLACGSLATELVKNKSYAKAIQAVSPENIIASLGGLPEGNLHCAHLVSKIFRLGLADGLAQKKAPWKKAYRRYEFT